MDFTKITFHSLLIALQSNSDCFISLRDYFLANGNKLTKIKILRHDVDRLPSNSLNFALLENSIGIKGTYYFRVSPESYDLEIMNKIAELGHEIGYHYEDVDLVSKECRVKNEELYRKNKEKYREVLIDMAYESFCKNLEVFRKNFDIKTICMHGSPRAKYDNKIIWKKYNYKDLGIIGEPYYDIDFNEFAYFTDTGRRWNGHKYSIRDKVKSKYNFDFKSTKQIIENIDNLPNRIMFTVHPERWNNRLYPWAKEIMYQNIKNYLKFLVIKWSKSRKRILNY